MDGIIIGLIEELKKIDEVEGIILGGSRARDNFDKNSDYDFYIYSKTRVPKDKREEILEKYFLDYELANTYWEEEDQGTLKEISIKVDLIYRDINWIEESLRNLIINKNVMVGYSTCIWDNFVNSKLIYDKDGELERLRQEFDVPYNEELSKKIIDKNIAVMIDTECSYTSQIIQVKKREDYIAINHRISAYLASYFDVIFAVNYIKHPGEKRLMELAKKYCKNLPKNMEKDLKELLLESNSKEFQLEKKINEINSNLLEIVN